ncbi:MAG TPA: potassium/proton antiporter [Syntrophales bacterium]|nr:potassium/proton antiporter [Syntrophales bacterium]
MIQFEWALIAASVLIIISVFTSKAVDRLGVPSLLIFLAVGMLAGSDGPGGIYFNNPLLAQSLGVIALSFILYDGGLATDWTSVRPVLKQGIVLSTLGVLLTAALVGWFVSFCFGFSPVEGFLLGSIISSTDAAAVFSVLRSKRVSLKGQLRPLLELESGSNDPMAVLLTTASISLLQVQDLTTADLIPSILMQLSLGAVSGYFMGLGLVYVMNHIRLEYDGLYPVLSIALVILTYSFSSVINGNGFLAVYAAGLVMGNRRFIHRRSLLRFHDGMAWLMQISMFLVLGLLVFPSKLPGVAGVGLAVTAFLMLAARPAAVFVCLAGSRFSLREKIMIAWVGLRGAVPIILATFPLLAGIPLAGHFFNIVFFVVFASALLQGTSVPFFARRLGLEAPLVQRPPYPIECDPAGRTPCDLVEVTVSGTSPAAGRQLVELGLPEGALIVLVNRGDEFLIPKGNMVLLEGDRLLFLANKEPFEKAREIIEPAEKS